MQMSDYLTRQAIPYLVDPGHMVNPFEGPQDPSVEVGAVVIGATQTELSSQRLVQLSQSCTIASIRALTDPILSSRELT